MAAKIMAGVTLTEQGVTTEVWPHYTSVKESVFPFNRFAGVDIILGPEMKSTGEVMGISQRLPRSAFAKSQIAAGTAPADRGQGLYQPGRRRTKTAASSICPRQAWSP